MNNTYLLLFTIGPVQSFIAQARKTQDLYAGSRILSTLAKAGIAGIQKDIQGKKPIFPSDPTAETVPNRFLCLITGDAKAIGKATEAAVKAEWQKMADNAWKKSGASDTDAALKTMFTAQVNDFLDINWAAMLFDAEKHDYKTVYKQLESQLGALKNARTWAQLDEPTGRKSSLSGEMNALFYQQSSGRSMQFLVKEAFAVNTAHGRFPNKYLIQKGEGLSAIDLIKRTYEKQDFPSTAGIALLHLKNHAALAAFNDTIKRVLNIDIEDNEQLYFKENLTDDYIEKQYKKEGRKDGKISIESLWWQEKSNILVAHKLLISSLNSDKMSSYYAVLRFDGDNMGKWLGGEYLKDEKKLQDFHQKLSELLSTFAKNTKNYIDDNNLGKTIYAGGDDFLAFLNLKDIFTTLQKIRNDFKTEVSDKLNLKFNWQMQFWQTVTV
jgi:CRISPR-associated protein Cmr2